MARQLGECKRCFRTAIWVSLVAALFLTVFKVMIGFAGGSRAMLGSALYSFTDLFSAILLLVGFKVADRPADKTHPYGHGKIEYIVSLIIGSIIVVSTVSLILLSTLTLYRIDAVALPHWIGIWASLACFFLGLIVYRLVRCAAKQANSPAMSSHAHHVHTDAYSNLCVVLAILIGEAGFKEADAIIAILEGMQILYECVNMMRKSFGHLMDAALAVSQVETIRALLAENPAVIRVDDIKGKHVGRGLSLDIEILLDGRRTIAECSATVRELERSLRRRIAHLQGVLIHYQPVPGR